MPKPLNLVTVLLELRDMGPQRALEWLDENEPIHSKQVDVLRYEFWKHHGIARENDYPRFVLHQLAENDRTIEVLQRQTGELIKIAKEQSGILQAINNSAYSSAKTLKASREDGGPNKQLTAMTDSLNGIRWATYVSFGALVYIAAVLVNRLH